MERQQFPQIFFSPNCTKVNIRHTELHYYLLNACTFVFEFMFPDASILQQIVTQKMPFGKYSGKLVCDLPISYLEWFKRKDGFPKGKLGIQLETVYEIKLNGLDEIIHKLKKQF